MKFKASKRSNIQSTAQEFTVITAKRSQTGKKVYRLHVGQPSTGAPKASIEAVKNAMGNNVLGYTSSLGLIELREKIANNYMDLYNVSIPASRIVITNGASGAIQIAAIASFSPGARIGLPSPSYPAYNHMFNFLGVEVVAIPTQAKNRFFPTVEELTPFIGRIEGLLIASPGNPSGGVLMANELNDISKFCDKNGIRFFSDEIYHGIEFETYSKAQTALKYSDEAIIINSFSKYYSMPGWRLGWMVVPEYLTKNIANVIRNLNISASHPSQIAAIAAMDSREELDQHVRRYAENRDILLHSLPLAGFDKFIRPQGAFYFYAHVEKLHCDSYLFCTKMLNECGIAAMPGCDFDPRHGHKYVRFSYAGSTNEIREAMEALMKWR